MILLIIFITVSIVIVLLMPKRLKISEMYTTSYFAVFLASLTDIYLDAKLDLYGFFNKGIDWLYIPIFVIIYPAVNIIFLNFFPYRKPNLNKIIYILIFSILTLIIEYISSLTNVFYHNEWKLWHSAICYPFLYTLLLLNLKLIRRLESKYIHNKKTNG